MIRRLFGISVAIGCLMRGGRASADQPPPPTRSQAAQRLPQTLGPKGKPALSKKPLLRGGPGGRPERARERVSVEERRKRSMERWEKRRSKRRYRRQISMYQRYGAELLKQDDVAKEQQVNAQRVAELQHILRLATQANDRASRETARAVMRQEKRRHNLRMRDLQKLYGKSKLPTSGGAK